VQCFVPKPWELAPDLTHCSLVKSRRPARTVKERGEGCWRDCKRTVGKGEMSRNFVWRQRPPFERARRGREDLYWWYYCRCGRGYVGQGGRDSNSCTITDLSWCVSSNTIGRDVGLPARGGGARYYHVTYHKTAFRLWRRGWEKRGKKRRGSRKEVGERRGGCWNCWGAAGGEIRFWLNVVALTEDRERLSWDVPRRVAGKERKKERKKKDLSGEGNEQPRRCFSPPLRSVPPGQVAACAPLLPLHFYKREATHHRTNELTKISFIFFRFRGL